MFNYALIKDVVQNQLSWWKNGEVHHMALFLLPDDTKETILHEDKLAEKESIFI